MYLVIPPRRGENTTVLEVVDAAFYGSGEFLSILSEHSLCKLDLTMLDEEG